MADNPLFEAQPRSAELVYGIIALIGGGLGLATCTGFYFHYSATEPESVPVFGVGAAFSLYLLVLAFRLLRGGSHRRHLVSHWTLIVVGVALALSAMIPAIVFKDWRLIGGLGPAAAALVLGIRRLRTRHSA